MKQLDPAAPPCICDHLIGMECGHHLGLTQRVRHEGFEPVARAVGWVPLAEVLDALRDDDNALLAWHLSRNPNTYLDVAGVRYIADYLAERFAGSAT